MVRAYDGKRAYFTSDSYGAGSTAIKFKGVRVSGVLDPGVEVNGDVATGMEAGMEASYVRLGIGT